MLRRIVRKITDRDQSSGGIDSRATFRRDGVSRAPIKAKYIYTHEVTMKI